jgi:hypothetical protein
LGRGSLRKLLFLGLLSFFGFSVTFIANAVCAAAVALIKKIAGVFLGDARNIFDAIIDRLYR